MQKNYLPITAVALIVVGVAGLLSGGMTGRDGMREMMSGRLPPGITPDDLPEPESAGANVLVRYCAQCHHLPNPAMQTAESR